MPQPVRFLHAGGAVAALLLTAAMSLAAQETIARGYPLDATGSIKIFNPAGSLRIIGWDRDSVAVTGTSRGATYFGGGGRSGIKVGLESTPGAAGGTATLTVRVPAAANVWARGASTDITVEGLTGSVDVGGVNGRVRVTGSPRDLTVESMDGAVEILGTPGVLRAKTASGSLSWTGSAEDALLGSVSGRISTLRGPLGRTRIETVSGDVVLDARLRPDAEVVIESHSGSIDLRLASDVPTRISADAARVTGAGAAPPVVGGGPGKRPPARLIELFGATDAAPAARITVRSFKGDVRLLVPGPTPR